MIPLNGTLPAHAATFKLQQFLALTVFSYVFIFFGVYQSLKCIHLNEDTSA
jgi:hypothetical protein